MNAKVVIAIIGLLTAIVGGGGYAISLDLSTNTNTSTDNSVTDKSTTTIVEGDTIIHEAPFDDGFVDEGDDELCDILIEVCYEELVPEEYEDMCPIVDIIC